MVNGDVCQFDVMNATRIWFHSTLHSSYPSQTAFARSRWGKSPSFIIVGVPSDASETSAPEPTESANR